MTGQYAKLGSVSSGTMRHEDLIPAFADALQECIQDCGPEGVHGSLIASALAGDDTSLAALFDWEQEHEPERGYLAHVSLYLEAISSPADPDEAEDLPEEILAELDDALSEYAPPYCYFGAHEGDGADYGFWVSWDNLEDDCRYGTVLKVEAGEEWPELDDCEYVLEVTDHGNGTLYTRDHVEVWSVV